MRYQGSYIIRKIANDNNYVCHVRKNFKTCHANLLKKFEEPQPIPPRDIILPHAAVSFIKDDDIVKPQPAERNKTFAARIS